MTKKELAEVKAIPAFSTHIAYFRWYRAKIKKEQEKKDERN